MAEASSVSGKTGVPTRSDRVSVILPVKNDAVRASRAIMSIRTYAPPDTEIVLIDNESHDDLFATLGPLADVYLYEAGKLSDCRRAGVLAATGDVLLFMDADQELRGGTAEAAVSRLHNCDAVVIPERPREESRLLHKVCRAERVWTEWLGFGVPRLIRRSTYDSTGGHLVGVTFGEDRFTNPKAARLGLSDFPIYHDEIGSLGELLKKYRGYGRKSACEMRNLRTVATHALHLPSRFGRPPDARDILLLPFAVALKLAKIAAFLEGLTSQRLNDSRKRRLANESG